MKNSLNPEAVKSLLNTEYIGKKFYFFESTTSTFDEADALPKDNGAVICARTQTSGRGRLGRQWQSQNGGIYFSVILKPDMDMDKVSVMTSLCAVGIQRAIERIMPCKIKWPNDIVSNDGKKLCGILTKIQSDADGEWCINVGIGINANTKSFDDELVYASSLGIITGNVIDENRLLCSCLEEIEKAVDIECINDTMADYKEKSITLGKRVRIIYTQGGKEVIGLCTDIADDGTLIVKKDDGEFINVNSGEVSVRGIYGERYV